MGAVIVQKTSSGGLICIRRAALIFIVKKKTTGYARGTKKAMPMRRKKIRKEYKNSDMVEYRHGYRH